VRGCMTSFAMRRSAGCCTIAHLSFFGVKHNQVVSSVTTVALRAAPMHLRGIAHGMRVLQGLFRELGLALAMSEKESDHIMEKPHISAASNSELRLEKVR